MSSIPAWHSDYAADITDLLSKWYESFKWSIDCAIEMSRSSSVPNLGLSLLIIFLLVKELLRAVEPFYSSLSGGIDALKLKVNMKVDP